MLSLNKSAFILRLHRNSQANVTGSKINIWNVFSKVYWALWRLFMIVPLKPRFQYESSNERKCKKPVSGTAISDEFKMFIQYKLNKQINLTKQDANYRLVNRVCSTLVTEFNNKEKDWQLEEFLFTFQTSRETSHNKFTISHKKRFPSQS